MRHFDWPIRIYYEDTDAGGIVYHANFLKYFERGRTEWLRHFSIDLVDLANQQGAIFVIKHASIDYRLPAVLNDELIVRSTIAGLNRASIVFEQSIHQQKEESIILATAKIHVVSVSSTTLKPVALPSSVVKEFSRVS